MCRRFHAEGVEKYLQLPHDVLYHLDIDPVPVRTAIWLPNALITFRAIAYNSAFDRYWNHAAMIVCL